MENTFCRNLPLGNDSNILRKEQADQLICLMVYKQGFIFLNVIAYNLNQIHAIGEF